jgi:hypothetical protein
VFTWACIRSLGQVGGTERSLSVLAELRKRLTNTILLSAIDVANQKIYGRIDELRQIERQLEEATPLTQAVPSEYQEDVALPEEEIILETPFIPPATSAGQPEPMGLSSPPRAR